MFSHIFILPFAILVSLAQARETRTSIDLNANLEELYKTGEIEISSTHMGGAIYEVDASAVLKVDIKKIAQASREFNRFKEFGMPNLRASRIVSEQPMKLVTWNWMGQGLTESKHCLEIDLHPNTQEWNLTPCPLNPLPLPRGLIENYDDLPAFTVFDGSWYLHPLDATTVYVRYFLYVAVDTWIPPLIVSFFINDRLKTGVVTTIETLAKVARSRQD